MSKDLGEDSAAAVVADELGATSAAPGLLRKSATLLHGRFRVKKLLGSGGMGEVYLAEQLSLNRDVALKVLRPAISAQAGMAERFRREALILSAVNHPAVVRVIDFGEDSGLSCLVMELVDGETLDIAMRNSHFSLPRVRRILEQLAEGLAAVHVHGIVHRDFKPQNVILCSTAHGEQARLLDFGIARLAESSSPGLTMAGLTIGTPEYLSPEQAMGTAVDHRSDIYSWGVVAYQLLAGELPFAGPLPQDFLVQHATGTPLPLVPNTSSGEVSKELCALVMSCLAKDPSARPSLLEISNTLGGSSIHPNPAVATGVLHRPTWLLQLRELVDAAKRVLRRRPIRALRASARTKLIALASVVALAVGILWVRSRHASPPERVRLFLSQGRYDAALEVMNQLDRDGKSLSPELRMLKASAFHGEERHSDEWSLAQDIEGPWIHFEPTLLAAACEDYGRNEKKAAPKEILGRFPEKDRNAELKKLAEGSPSAGQWGAVRYLDQSGLESDLTALYSASLKSEDCRIRGMAANRLGELGDPHAVEALEALRAIPKKRSLIFEQDCGQDEAAAAIRKIKKRQEK